jgi:hypothetical protein
VLEFPAAVDALAVEHFDDGDVGHSREGCGAAPMLFARREPDAVARANFLDRSFPTLHPAAARLGSSCARSPSRR